MRWMVLGLRRLRPLTVAAMLVCAGSISHITWPSSDAPVASAPLKDGALGPLTLSKSGLAARALLSTAVQASRADAPTQGCGIAGRVTFAGSPVEGVRVELFDYVPATLAGDVQRGDSRTTGADGRYVFPPIKDLKPDHALYVRFLNTRAAPADNDRLAVWFGPDVTRDDLTAEGCTKTDVDDLEISDVRLDQPASSGSKFAWGTPFAWFPRTLPPGAGRDRFKVCFAEWHTKKDLKVCIPAMAIEGTTLVPDRAARPVELIDGEDFGWYVRVERGGSAFGTSRWMHQIQFEGVVPAPSPTDTPTQTPTMTATPAVVVTAERPSATPTASGTATPHPPTLTSTATVTPVPPPDVTPVCPGDEVRGRLEVHLPPAPLRADVLLVFDATGSMQPTIDAAKSNAQQIMSELASVIPDIQFGVSFLRDYPDPDPYRLVQPITGDRTLVQSALGSFAAGGGGTGYQEAYTRALYESYADPSVGWRAKARRFVLVFGDQVPHDDDLNSGIANAPFNPGSGWCGDPNNCMLDWGRDGTLGTSDDLDFQEVLEDLKNQDITLLHIAAETGFGAAWRDAMVRYWDQWAKVVNPGGSSVPLDSASSLPTTIVDLVRSAGQQIGRLAIEVAPGSYSGWVSTSPPELTNLVIPSPGGRTEYFEFAIQVPPTEPLNTLHVITLRAIGDGVQYAERTLRLYTAPSCVPPPTVQPKGRFIIGIPSSTRHRFPGTYASTKRLVRRSGPASGVAASGIQVQNLDGARTLNATAYFFPQLVPYDRPPTSPTPPAYPIEVHGIPPHASANLYLPKLGLPFGIFSAAMLDEIDLKLAAVVRTNWMDTGAAALYHNAAPGFELTVPVVVREFNGQTSIISVMSDGNDRLVEVEMSFFARGSAAPVTPTLRFPLQPYEGVTFDLLDSHPAFDALGSGFLGSARLRLVFGPEPARTDTGAYISAISYVNTRSSKRAVWGFEAVPSAGKDSQAAEKVFVPLWRSRHTGGALPTDRMDTGIAVVNPNDRPVTVIVDAFPTDNLDVSAQCRSVGPFSLLPVTIAPHSNHVFYQGPGTTDPFPDDCFGSAVVRTTQPGDTILAVVNDAQNLRQLAAAYNAIPATQAHRELAVPLFRSLHGANHLTTGIQVMNVGERTASMRIDFLAPLGPGAILIDGCGIACSALVPPMQSHTWYPPSIAAIGPNTVGSAIIFSSEPAVAVVMDVPMSGCCVDTAAYTAIPMFGVPMPGARPLVTKERNRSIATFVP